MHELPNSSTIILPGQQWPAPQDYNEAVQTTSASFSDAVLRRAIPELNAIGLPKATSGAFASVYRMMDGDQTFALRFFLRAVAGQNARYETLSRFIMSDDLPYTVPFQYISQGVRIKANWFPVIKMEWVSGVTLDEYVRRNIGDSSAINQLADKVELMCSQLREAGVAHGDLQHGNIIVIENGDLRLVDYDGMFVPEMQGQLSMELGHRNYQHPRRSAQHFSAALDAFSELVIVNSLRILARDPELFHQLRGGDECLILRQHDYTRPLHSLTFHTLENHADETIRYLARSIRWQLQSKPDEVLPSTEIPAELPELEPVTEARAEILPVHTQELDHSLIPHMGNSALTGSRSSTTELVSLRKQTERQFHYRGLWFESRYLNEKFKQEIFDLLFGLFKDKDSGILRLFLLAFAIAIIAYSRFGLSFLPVVTVLVFVVMRIRAVVRQHRRYRRLLNQVKHRLPIQATCTLRENTPGLFDRLHVEYRLIVDEDPAGHSGKVKHSTALGSDPRVLDIFPINKPTVAYIYTDPDDHSVVARVTANSFDWLI